MKSLIFIVLIAAPAIFPGCKENKKEKDAVIIGNGQMPNAAIDHTGNIHVVYGSDDSLMYAFSKDHGKSFSAPVLISILPELAASAMRGPQIVSTTNGITVIACSSPGDIFSFNQQVEGKWMQTAKVNDIDTVAKENLIALGGDEQNVFAVWLDLRGDKHNKIVGAKSTDGGKSWSKNMVIYASPDSTVCECCKPSVIVKGDDVYVMFRNWLNGNRDLYLIQSSDGGKTFGKANKLGNGSWPLDGCPMDGGGIAISNGNPQTVWRRQEKIYACEPGKPETLIGEGKGCTVEIVHDQNLYAWTENGEVTVMKPQGMKKSLGKGALPTIKAISNEHVFCVWENEKQIQTAILDL